MKMDVLVSVTVTSDDGDDDATWSTSSECSGFDELLRMTVDLATDCAVALGAAPD